MLSGKKFLVTGVLNESSIAYSAARQLQQQGAEIVLTSYGRARRLTERCAERLPTTPQVLELDVTRPADFEALGDRLARMWGQLDGALHAVAFAPETCLGGDFLRPRWEDVSVALEVSAYSLKALAETVAPLMEGRGGSLVGLDFDAGQAWPDYNWMGVAKAALESTARYLARDLGPRGIRVNLVSAGPLSTIAANAIPQIDALQQVWKARAPLGWDPSDPDPAGRTCVTLLSDWLPATTGEIVHVDGGAHAIGMAPDERTP
ncbi:enoyl-ACP reductase FabI [Streptomyces sp. ME19-01-6]|uniref:enoyl-ACP reductase FabI n=1 Tax=Streptomyces sp. ME19-01-6 TaxID=3028686 RepID=UPI0029B8E840|nr:enoyl-ACP reductase FabI [Streptomyces sp. ME19-01-6]MDX3225003.1 enoyl-ACP reductase FabI [Streptomyces sp. ME19-01-6]